MEWISVKDRMPNNDMPIFIVDVRDIVINKQPYWFAIDVCYYEKGDEPYYTHWMPLPEQPNLKL